MKAKYTVENVYSTDTNPMTGSIHRTPEAALSAASRREGCGWIVRDTNGDQWQMDGNRARCV